MDSTSEGDRALLLQEADELTSLLRNEPILNDLRLMIGEQGLDPKHSYLVAFIENGEGLQGGVVLSPESECYEFERNVLSSPDFYVWHRLSDFKEVREKFPSVEAIIRLVNARL